MQTAARGFAAVDLVKGFLHAALPDGESACCTKYSEKLFIVRTSKSGADEDDDSEEGDGTHS